MTATTTTTTTAADNAGGTGNGHDARRVLVIGFGMSGIIAIHTLFENGLTNVTVVEACEGLGGVWNVSKQYPGLQTNNTKNTFEFPEMRYDDDQGTRDDFPTQEQVHAYLKTYANKFGLEKNVNYGTRVVELRRRRRSSSSNDGDDDEKKEEGKEDGLGGGDNDVGDNNNTPWKFDVTFSKPVNGSTSGTFDFVVMAVGNCCKPRFPEGFKASSSSVTTVMHSSEIRARIAKDPTLFEGKRVAVIGTAKSGQDVAVWAAKKKKEEEDGGSGGGASVGSVTLIGSAIHWNAPRYLGDNDPKVGQYNEEVLYSRFSEWMLPCEPECARVNGAVPKMLYFFQKSYVGMKLRDFFWSKVTSDIVKQFDIPERLQPKVSFVADGAYIAIQNPDFFRLEKEGKIKVVFGKAAGYNPRDGEIFLEGNKEDSGGEGVGNFDIVVLATGFQIIWDFCRTRSDLIFLTNTARHGCSGTFTTRLCRRWDSSATATRLTKC